MPKPPPEGEEDVAAAFANAFKKTRRFLVQTALNYHAFVGNQWVGVTVADQATFRILNPNEDELTQQQRSTTNHLQGDLKANAARIMPYMDVFITPNMGDDVQKMMTAITAQREMDIFLRRKDMTAFLYKMLLYGSLGPVYAEVVQDEGSYIPGTRMNPVITNLVSPFEIIPFYEERASEMDDWAGFWRIRTMEMSTAKKLFGSKAKDMPKSLDAFQFFGRAVGITQYTSFLFFEFFPQYIEPVSTIEEWRAPCPDYPDGLVRIFDSKFGFIAETKKLPKGVTRIPYVKYEEGQACYGIFGIPSATWGRQKQILINKLDSSTLNHVYTYTDPPLLYDPAKLQKGQDEPFHFRAGAEVKINSDQEIVEPKFMLVPPIPPDNIVLRETYRRQMAEILGGGKISNMNEQPTNTRTMQQLGTLAETENNRIADPRNRGTWAAKSLMSRILEATQKSYSGPQEMSKVRGISMEEATAFLQMNVANEMSVNVNLGPSGGMTHMQLVAMTIQASGGQPIYDPSDPAERERAQRIIFGGSPEIGASQQPDREQQWREIKKMIDAGTPQPLPINSLDNHRVHFEICRQFMKAPAYEKLDEAAQIAIQGHAELHNEVLARQVQAQMETQLMLSGKHPLQQGNGGPPGNGKAAPAPAAAATPGGGAQ